MVQTIKIEKISYDEAIDFLLPLHYSGRIPQISYAYGWFIDNELQAVCTFGKPVSHYLCTGICGEKYHSKVFELNRLCRLEKLNQPLSQFVGGVLRELSKENLIIVSYSDTDMNHNGYIYQATNFIYTGITKGRTDKYTPNNKHSRHYDNNNQGIYRKIRSPKHRYIYFAMKNRRLKKECLENLNYPILPYPKGDNKTYKLGEYQKVKLINTLTGKTVEK